MAQCEAPCTAYPYVKRMKQIRISENSYWHINREENCTSFNVVYLIECDKENCTMKYIRENKEFFFFMIRLDDHRGYILPKDKSQATGAHFNLPGHSLAYMKATIIEQVKVVNHYFVLNVVISKTNMY